MSDRSDRSSDSAASTLPERLRAVGGTDLERRVLAAAAREQPPRELCERMALGIGVAPPQLFVAEQGLPDPGAGAPLAPQAAAGSRALLPWISGAVVVALAGAFLATRPDSSSSSSTQPVSQPVATSAPAPVSAVAPTEAPRLAEARAPEAEAPPVVTSAAAPRSRSIASSVDIQDQIALVDAARAAVASGANNRALSLVRKYQSKYPAGSFGPEAAALKIEALTKLGRNAEARALAERFVAAQRGSPLGDRVARLTGIARR